MIGKTESPARSPTRAYSKGERFVRVHHLGRPITDVACWGRSAPSSVSSCRYQAKPESKAGFTNWTLAHLGEFGYAGPHERGASGRTGASPHFTLLCWFYARRLEVMAKPLLSDEVFDSLQRYNTPTISNAIELFNLRPRHVGFLPHTIRCLLPDIGPVVGYAVTSQTRAAACCWRADQRTTAGLSEIRRRDDGTENRGRRRPR